MTRSRSSGRPRARFDLHLHSTRSDGRLAPAELLQRCAEARLDVVAITDHDIGPSLPPGRHRMAGRDIVLVHGAEVSGVHEGREYHLLVYFPGEMPADFHAFLRSLCDARVERYRQGLAATGLDDVAGPPVAALEGLQAVTRTHLSQAIVDAGHARDLHDAFARFTGNSTGNVPPVSLHFVDAIARARDAGGLTSWAHPPLDDAKRLCGTFAAAGLQGLETARPGLGPQPRNALLRLACKHGLLATGGSDFHGLPYNRALGSWSFPAREARGFARALSIPV